jgi:hypothetical protein
MMMKKTFVMMLLLLAIYASPGFGIVYTGDSPSLSAIAESITPNPAEPGQDISIQLRVYNNGQGLAKDVSVEVIPGEMFRLIGEGTDLSRNFSLCASCSKDSLYTFSVSPLASSAEYPLMFRIWTGNSFKEETIDVRVTGTPDLVLETSAGTDIRLGSAFDLDIRLGNEGTGVARNIKITPSSQGYVIENANLIFIDELKPGQYIERKVRMLVSDSVEPGSQSLDFTIKYKDEESIEVQGQLSIGIQMKSDVKMGISSVSFNPQALTSGSDVQLIVRVENLGEGDARNVQVIVDSDRFSGQKRSFIGQLDEDEDAPAYFMLKAGNPGNSDMGIIVSYEDDIGKHEIRDSLPVDIRAPKASLAIAAAALLTLAAGTYTYLRRKK